jgi:hypothetical protein
MYETDMAGCEACWRETGDPLAVSEAQLYAHIYRQPPPKWLTNAVVALAVNSRGKEPAKRAIEDHKHFMRYEVVRDATKLDGWSAGLDRAVEVLARTYAGGDVDTMKRSYALVKRDLEAGRGGKYHMRQPGAAYDLDNPQGPPAPVPQPG